MVVLFSVMWIEIGRLGFVKSLSTHFYYLMFEMKKQNCSYKVLITYVWGTITG